MSSTKIVIIVLVLIVVIFVIFVLTGAFSSKSNKNSNESGRDFTKNPPGWTKAIKNFVGSKRPKLTLKEPKYTANTEEKILPDSKNPIRTATFRVRPGSIPSIVYDDDTKDAGDLKHQPCDLPNFDNKDDPYVCTIVALKGGGTLRITCPTTGACLVNVEK